jgi:RNA polymerase sigma-70 factor (ECF subfamily)
MQHVQRPMPAPVGRLRRYRAQAVLLDAAMNSTEPETQASLQDDPDLQPDRIAMRAEIRQLMEAHIDMLPDAFRSVFTLRAVEQLSVEEVSQALKIPEATVRTRFFRARNLLREGLSHHIDRAISDAFSFDGERCDRIVAAVLARVAEDRESRGG